MPSASPENMSTNSWNALPKAERMQTLLKLQETNNKMKQEIDDDQKTLAHLRQTIPDECEELFKEEKVMLLKHYTTADLIPHLPERGLTTDDIKKMGINMTERVEAQVADQEETKHIAQETSKIRQENEMYSQKVLDLATSLLRRFED